MTFTHTCDPSAARSNVARSVDSVADLCSLCHLPCGFCGRSSGLSPGMVHQGHPQTQRGRERHPGTEGGKKAAGASGHGQHKAGGLCTESRREGSLAVIKEEKNDRTLLETLMICDRT
ncbi:small integral membrane protein 12 isoform X1 [Oreochromis niloticus]|uniref:small integral membrane protein 12 isoform X1 n=1 Tax=Oreochromis niloticus TaxID=8128 RepID=UPI000DF14BDA|nr:small integral membrane protein 12 isoform X1 [Oreochromis niloticus]